MPCARARKAGADAAEVVVRAASANGIGVRLGQLEDVERSEGQRYFACACLCRTAQPPACRPPIHGRGRHSPMHWSNAAVAMARRGARRTPMPASHPKDLLFSGDDAPDFDLDDPAGEADPAALARGGARAVEEAARAVAGRHQQRRRQCLQPAWPHPLRARSTSHGFAGWLYGSQRPFSLSASVIGGRRRRDMQRDYGWHSARIICRTCESGCRPSARRAGTNGPSHVSIPANCADRADFPYSSIRAFQQRHRSVIC